MKLPDQAIRVRQALGAAIGCVALLIGCNASHEELSVAPVEPIPEPLLIEIRGEEFVWRFRYAGQDGEFGTDDDRYAQDLLRLPHNSQVIMRTASEDYVYSLRIQELGLSQIAVPGLSYSVEFQSDQVGEFEMPSDPMCGLRFFHDDTMGRMRIVDRDEFQQWWNSPNGRS